MNRLSMRLRGIILANLIPAFLFAGENSTGPDMNKYGLWASYIFFVIIFLFIIFFIYSSSHEEVYIPAKIKSPSSAASGMNLQSRAILAPLKLTAYSIISIIFLYIIIFILLIT